MPDYGRPDYGRPDYGRPDYGRPDQGRSSEPSLDDIHRSDSFIEALAAGHPVAPQDHTDAALAALLGGWRDETRWPPDAGLISESQAIAALNAGLAEKPGRTRTDRRDAPVATRNRRGLSVVGAAAAAALCIGGFGAVVSGSEPGDSLYGLRTMLFGTPKEVRDGKVALAARSELLKVQELISQGDWQQAQEKLVAVSTQVAAVGDEQQKQELLTQFNDLSAKVVERDPAATAPPGIVYTVPPSAAELVPAVAPPSETTTTTTETPTTSATTSSETSPVTSSTTPSSASSATESSAPSTSASSSVSAPASTTAPASASAPASTSAPAPASTAPTSSPAPAAATSAPSTAAPDTRSAPTETASQSPAAASGPPSTSTASPTQPTTTEASDAADAADGTDAADAPATSATEPVSTSEPAVTTTVAPAPVPAG